MFFSVIASAAKQSRFVILNAVKDLCKNSSAAPQDNKVKWIATSLALFAMTSVGHAQVIKISISSGTGFFVSRSGHVLTNLHVVNQCRRIVVAGAFGAQLAQVVGRNARHDLALLRVDATGTETGLFRDDLLPVKKGERVAIIGYPGESWRTGKTVTREAEIISDKGPRGEDTWIQLSDMIEHGNSGGPLLDGYGNVIGVIVAKAVIYTYQKSAPENGTYNNSGVAIANSVVKKFLGDYRVPYAFSDAQSALSADRLTDKAQRFVVNVRCETPTELR